MAPPVGISIAPADDVFTEPPGWMRIDQTYNIRSWTIDRGRPNEMSKTDVGTATIELVDTYGDWDPTNDLSPIAGVGPLTQAAICLQNPNTLAWTTLFRGYISQLQWSPYQTKQWANVTLELVDGMALLAAMEMPLDGTYGDDAANGNIIFDEDTALNAVKTRIDKILTQAGWPTSLRSVFTGNVGLQGGGRDGRGVYAPRSTVLQVIQDAADAEFPDTANVYIGGPRNPGCVVFHGRYARFNPADVSYGIRTWQLGDRAAYTANPTTVVQVSPPLVASLDDSYLYTSALAAPQNIKDGELPGQYVTDALAAAYKGLRTWSAENLQTAGGQGPTTALQETKKFAQYIVNNMVTPQVRVGQLTIKTRNPAGPGGPKTWELFGEIDISDIVHLKTTHPVGGGGFDTDFFVEGIHYTARPGPGDPAGAIGPWHIIELTLDVSPRGYYTVAP